MTGQVTELVAFGTYVERDNSLSHVASIILVKGQLKCKENLVSPTVERVERLSECLP